MTARTEHSHIFETSDAIGLELLDRHFVVRFHATLSGGAINFHRHATARMALELTSALRLVISAHLQNKGAVPFAISVQSGEKSTFSPKVSSASTSGLSETSISVVAAPAFVWPNSSDFNSMTLSAARRIS